MFVGANVCLYASAAVLGVVVTLKLDGTVEWFLAKIVLELQGFRLGWMVDGEELQRIWRRWGKKCT